MAAAHRSSWLGRVGWSSSVVSGTLVALAFGVTAVAAMPLAAASDGESGTAPTLEGSLDTATFAERRGPQDVVVTSPLLHLGMRVREDVELGFGMGVSALFADGPERGTMVRPGNLMLGMRYIRERHASRAVTWSVGFGFALPTDVSASPSEERALAYAAGTRGGWNPWMWQPWALGIIVPAQVRAEVVPRLVLGADAAVGGSFVAGPDPRMPAATAQLAGTVRYAFRWFAASVRLAGVYHGRNADGESIGSRDPTQASVGAGLDAGLCRRNVGRRIAGLTMGPTASCPVVIKAGFDLNLDEPYGMLGEGRRIWGAQVGLGWAVF